MIDLLSSRIREFGSAFGFRDDVTFVLARRQALRTGPYPGRRIVSVANEYVCTLEVIISLYDTWSVIELRTPMLSKAADGRSIILKAQAAEQAGSPLGVHPTAQVWTPDAVFRPSLQNEPVFFVSG